ncbi:hypothetical protein [Calderihabitans maritimus]|uniref:Formiminotransferase C-terminal subdomain domain-containing protein n=1 Tax=Calderihabitans maritimus TaxID=1246530 RepID=A0A1Z5HRR8_9FIRM|nr:hypothetical protein [Calderihabitans maritimus]GAW92219.1 hypothetical protein KKC1_13770 [Calderihabitans maritimus]
MENSPNVYFGTKVRTNDLRIGRRICLLIEDYLGRDNVKATAEPIEGSSCVQVLAEVKDVQKVSLRQLRHLVIMGARQFGIEVENSFLRGPVPLSMLLRVVEECLSLEEQIVELANCSG